MDVENLELCSYAGVSGAHDLGGCADLKSNEKIGRQRRQRRQRR
jgi:hypothetical protein